MKHYDHILIGTGQASTTILPPLLASGQKIAVIEGASVGGTCVNNGCTPTKTLVASARVAQLIRRAAEYGVHAGSPQIDFGAVMARVNGIRHGNRDRLTEWMKSEANIDFYAGWASFSGERRVKVGDQEMEGERIYIHVGASPRLLDIPGLAQSGVMTNIELLELKELPEHLLILGGSYIGLEFGQVFRRLGSKVTVLEAAPQITPREDDDICTQVRSMLEEEGMVIHSGVKIQSVQGTSPIEIRYEHGGSSQTISGSHLLAAVGRSPNTAKLNLAAAGVRCNAQGFIETDEYLQTSAPGIFALGDVNGRGAFTHTAVHDGQVMIANWQGRQTKVSDRQPIFAMFTDPPLARIGLNEKDAQARGIAYRLAQRPMERINRAREMGETKGSIKILVEKNSERFLGATILGVGGDEIINHFAPYLYAGLTVKEMQRAVLVHPTVSELLPFILETLA
ncbi:MAG: mercuric reductase [Leptospirales bacterium]|nr:mercuric reductase [Leptospirales bacterium]